MTLSGLNPPAPEVCIRSWSDGNQAGKFSNLHLALGFEVYWNKSTYQKKKKKSQFKNFPQEI